MQPADSHLVFAFDEDGLLSVFENVAAAVREFEGVDVASGTVKFYAEDGTFLEPRFLAPNKRGKLLGLMPWVVSGTYDLIANQKADEDSFALALLESHGIQKNPWFSSLQHLKEQLRSKGVMVDY